MRNLLYLVTEDWFFYIHRSALARAAKENGYQVTIITRVSQYKDILESEGLRVIDLNWSRGSKSVFPSVHAILSIAKHYRKIKPDIIHHVSLKPIILGSVAALFSVDKKKTVLVNNFTGMGSLFVSKEKQDTYLRMIIYRAYKYFEKKLNVHNLVENPSDKQLLIDDFGIHPGNITTICSIGVDVNRFRLQPEPPGIPVIMLVSRLIWDKGIRELVLAVKILREKGLEFKMVLVGVPDRDNPSCIDERYLNRLSAEGVFEWWGYKKQIEEIWKLCHIAVLPSYREGAPRSLLEASSTGRPIVTTDVPGCRDVVIDGETGIVVPPANAEKLAKALELLLRDDVLRKKMGQRGRDYMVESFRQEDVINKTLELYADPN